jgi:hypothetical protein
LKSVTVSRSRKFSSLNSRDAFSAKKTSLWVKGDYRSNGQRRLPSAFSRLLDDQRIGNKNNRPFKKDVWRRASHRLRNQANI